MAHNRIPTRRGEPPAGAHPHGSPRRPRQETAAAPFPPIDPTRVDCTAFRTGNAAQCYQTAHEVFQLASLILSQFAANDFAAAERILPNTPQMFPDGTVIRGIDPDVLPTIAAWAAATISPSSRSTIPSRRPLDKDLVILFGGLLSPSWTTSMGGGSHHHDAQTEMFRRNPQMPRGWELVYEQIPIRAGHPRVRREHLPVWTLWSVRSFPWVWSRIVNDRTCDGSGFPAP